MHSIVELIKFGFVWDLNGIDIVDFFFFFFFLRKKTLILLIKVGEIHLNYIIDM